MYQFFDNRGYPVSVVQVDHHCVLQIDRQSVYKRLRRKILIVFHSLSHCTRRRQNLDRTGLDHGLDHGLKRKKRSFENKKIKSLIK